MDYNSVTDLPGIGKAYGNRLNQAGYSTANDIYKKFSSYNFDKESCQQWLKSVSGANSRYSSNCYETLKAMQPQPARKSYSPNQHTYQPQRPYMNESQELDLYQLPREPRNQPSYSEPTQFGFLNRTSRKQSPERNLYTPVQQTPSRSVYIPQQSLLSNEGSDINKKVVLEMSSEIRNKQEGMANQIQNLEQEILRNNNYIRSLETKMELMEKKATALVNQQDAKIEELTCKLRDMDCEEQNKNISSYIYLLCQKFDNLLKEFNEIKEKSTTHQDVKALESNIEKIETNATMIQKQQDEKISALTENISSTNTHINQYKEVISSINLIAQKLRVDESTTAKQGIDAKSPDDLAEDRYFECPDN